MFENEPSRSLEQLNEFSFHDDILQSILDEKSPSLPEGEIINIGRQAAVYEGSVSTYPLLPFEVSVNKDRIAAKHKFSVRIDKESLEGATSIGSSIPSGLIRGKDVRTFPHDFTFFPIADETDVRICDILTGVNTPLSNLTPDYVRFHQGELIVMEFATTQDDRTLIRVLNQKLDKYRIPLREAAKQYSYQNNISLIINFCVIVVSEYCVASTHKLSMEHINELIYRYRLSYSIQSCAYYELGLDREISTESEDVDQLKMIFKSIHVVDLGGEFSLENYKAIIENPSKEEETNIVHRIISDAKKQVKQMTTQYEKRYKPGSMKLNPNVAICSDMYNRYLESAVHENSTRGLREDRKSMVQFPFMNLSRVSKYNFYKMIRENVLPPSDPNDSVLSLIRSIVFKIDSGDVYVPEDDECKMESLADIIDSSVFSYNLLEDHILHNKHRYSKKSQEQIINRASYHRVIVRLSSDEELDLAKYGIHGKRYSNHAEIKCIRDEKKKFFNPVTTETDDLDLLLNDKDLIKTFFEENNELVGIDLDTKKLIFLGLEQHSNPPDFLKASSEYFDTVLRSNIGSFCSLISDIGVELSISIKQNCSKDEFIVKKLRHFNLWLVIKPTRSTSHIFFSVFTYCDQLRNSGTLCDHFKLSPVFKSLKQNGDFLYTEFISLNISKLVNWVLCESRLYSAYGFWLNAYGVPAYYQEDVAESYGKSIEQARQMTFLSVMVNLIDKAEVEEHMSLLRYITLEGLTSSPNIPRPYKMFEKFSKQIRSRFTLWVIRKLYDMSIHISDGAISLTLEKINDIATNTANRKVWTGFMNPYINQPIDSPQLMINLFYLGYLKNKDEYPENNTLSKLYEKILVIEDELTELGKESIGRVDKVWGDNSKHEYNITLLKVATNYTINHLEKKNPNFKRDLESMILGNLGRTKLDPTFTTLKASSSFNSDLFALKEVTKKYHRMKVVEALTKNLNNEDFRLIDILPEVCEDVFKRRYLLIDIFQKNQHGGLREIYVLGLFDRIVQYVVETISRTICLSFPGETMTHPNNKKLIPESHHTRSKQRFSSSYVTFGVSADASKWSQNHYAHKFSIFLLRFLPKYMHGFIWQTLHLWKDKRIMLNPKLIEILDDSSIEGFYSTPIQKLYDSYHGHCDIEWYSRGNSYIKTKTGMMQGILHYTSSLLHAIVNDFSKDITLGLLSTCMDKRDLPEIDMLESSDDSAMLFSIAIREAPNSLRKAHMYACLSQEIKSIIGREVSIINSIKTTNASLFFYEFNSEFKFGSNHYRPDIKFMISLPLISEQEALISRQEEWSTLLTQYIENGGSTWPVHLGQISQALLHYRLMGSSVCKEFESFQILVSYLRDPSQGFFLMDPILTAGLLGFKYNLWNACKQSNLGIIYKRYLFSATGGDHDSLEVTSSGNISRTVKLIYGNREKWLKMLDRVGVESEWRDQINEDFRMLYVGIESNRDLKRMISLKLHTSGVSESISKGNVISRTISSSVYILTFQCLTRLKEWQAGITDDNKKVSLFDLLRESCKILQESNETLTDHELSILFPFHHDFDAIRVTLNNMSQVQLRPTYKDYRRRITNIEISNSVKVTSLPLKDIVTQVWYPDAQVAKISPRSANILFEEYRNSIPWLDIDPSKTVLNSPFDDAISLYNWITSVSTKERVVRLLGTPIVSYHGKSNLISAILLNFQTNFKLESKNDPRLEDRRSSLKHILYMISRSPFSNERAGLLIEEALRCPDLRVHFCGAMKHSKDNSLSIIQSASNGAPVISIAERIKNNRMGIVGGFTTRGESKRITTENGYKVCYDGNAVWEGFIHGVNVKLRTGPLDMTEILDQDQYTGVLSRVEVEDPAQFLYIMSDVKSLCIELKLKFGHRDHIRLRSGTAMGFISSGVSMTYGIPVIKGSSRSNFSVDGIRTVDVQITRTHLRLRAIMNDFTGLRVTLVSYSIAESDFFDAQMFIPDSFIDRIPQSISMQTVAWLTNSPLSLVAATSLINNVASIYELGIERSSPKDKYLAEVIREVLIATLIRLGFNQKTGDNQYRFAASKADPEVIEPIEEAVGITYNPSWDDEFDFNFEDDNNPSEDMSASNEMWEAELMVEDERFDIEQLIEILNEDKIIKFSEASLFRRHNLLTVYVSDIFSKFAIPNLNDCFNKARVNQTTMVLRNVVAIYIGSSPSAIPVIGPEDEPSCINVTFD